MILALQGVCLSSLLLSDNIESWEFFFNLALFKQGSRCIRADTEPIWVVHLFLKTWAQARFRHSQRALCILDVAFSQFFKITHEVLQLAIRATQLLNTTFLCHIRLGLGKDHGACRLVLLILHKWCLLRRDFDLCSRWSFSLCYVLPHLETYHLSLVFVVKNWCGYNTFLGCLLFIIKAMEAFFHGFEYDRFFLWLALENAAIIICR